MVAREEWFVLAYRVPAVILTTKLSRLGAGFASVGVADRECVALEDGGYACSEGGGSEGEDGEEGLHCELIG